MKRSRGTALAALLVAAGVCHAWHGKGHHLATTLAVKAAQDRLPAFVLKGVDTVAHCSLDPDLFRLRSLPELRDQQRGEHFFDLELLRGDPIPATRSAFTAWCARKGLKPSQVGTAPYAVAEWTQRLTLAFAEHRKWPKNPHIRSKCLVYAGLLAHYAQDLCQPLHTTVHYDGRLGRDGKSPRTGIHAKVDALLQKMKPRARKMRREMKLTPFPRLMPAIRAELRKSHALMDSVYKIEKHLPALEAPLLGASPAASFAEERLTAGVRFTATLYLTAWQDSEKLELPKWHERSR